MFCFYCTQTYMKLQSVFSREIFNTIFARLPPLASAARCGPHPLCFFLWHWDKIWTMSAVHRITGIRRILVRGVNTPLPPEAKKFLKI